MKKLKRIFCMLFATVTAFTAFASCKDNEDGSSSSSSGEEVKIEYTDYDLVKNGVSEYKIVEMDETLEYERFAKSELVEFFYEATGITLQTVTESEVEYNDNAKLIILGDTKFTEKAGENVSEIPQQGFTLKTVGSNLFVLGVDHGVLYGVYEFLHQTFGFEVYAEDEIALAKNVKDMKLQKFDFSDCPDILYRQPNYSAISASLTTARRYRMESNIWITQKGNFVHNTFSEYFPKSDYQAQHPDFYSLDGSQLCYTAHGNAEELQLMQDLTLERMKTLINRCYSVGDFRGSLSFTQEDYATWCNCEACTKDLELYGAQSSSLIRFINPVAKRLREWLAEEWPGHEVNIAIFAYLKSRGAPVQQFNGEYMPARKLTAEELESVSNGQLNGQTVYQANGVSYVEEESLYLEENVAMFYAPLEANFMYDFDNSKNEGFMTTLVQWGAISKKVYLWLYSCHFSDYLIWYDSFNSMQPLYRMAKEIGSVYMFDQGRYNAGALTAFDMLKCYLNSKLAWNVDADYTGLIDDFFANYFKNASAPMRKYFNSFRIWSEYLKANTKIPGQVQSSISDKTYWPKRILEEWQGYIKEAYKAIEPLKATDKTAYEKVYERIEKEEITIRFHLYDLHGDSYTPDELTELRRQCKADIIRLGFTKISEGGSLTAYIESSWGV